MRNNNGVTEFCIWARSKFGSDGARQYIVPDLYELDEELRARMVNNHFAVWAEFMAYYARYRMGVK